MSETSEGFELQNNSLCPIFLVTAEGLRTLPDHAHAYNCHLLSDLSALTLPFFQDWYGSVNGSADRTFRFAHAHRPTIPYYEPVNYSPDYIKLLLQSTVALGLVAKLNPEDCPFLLGPVLDHGVSVHEVTVEMLLANVSELPDVQAAIHYFCLAQYDQKRKLFSRPNRDERRTFRLLRNYVENGKRIHFSSGMVLPVKVNLGETTVTCAVCLGEEIGKDKLETRQFFRAKVYAYGALETIPPKTILTRELMIDARNETVRLCQDICVIV